MNPTGKHERASEARSSSSEGDPLVRSSLDWARQAGVGKFVIREMEARIVEKHRRQRRRLAIIGGTLALAIIVAGSWRDEPPAVEHASSPTAVVAQPARQQLPDGSTVEFGPDGAIAVDFRANVRRIAVQHGELHFQVTKDANRPFIVSAGNFEVRAVGTAFSVRRGPGAIDVLVTEGTVALDRPAAPGSTGSPEATDRPAAAAHTIAMVEAGHRVSVATAPSAGSAAVVLPVSPRELADRLSWRVPRLEFSGTLLSEALALFNRHSAIRLTLADAQLGRLKLSGIVRADNVDTLLQLLHAEFGLTEERRSENEVLLRQGSASDPRDTQAESAFPQP